MIPAHVLPSSVYGLNAVQLPLTTHTEPQSSSSSSGYSPPVATIDYTYQLSKKPVHLRPSA